MVDSLNKLKKIDLARLVEISMDGVIDVSEKNDFMELKRGLNSISKAYGALLRWEEDGNTIGA